KRGEAVAAAAAFRRAGQDALAAELENAATLRRPGTGSAPVQPPSLSAAPAAAAPAALQPSPLPAPAPSEPAPAAAPAAPAPVAAAAPGPPFFSEVGAAAPAPLGEAQPVPLVGFALSRLGMAAAPRVPRDEALRLIVADEAHLRADAVLAGVNVRWEP